MARHYANKKITKISDYFDNMEETTKEPLKFTHYKTIILEKILHDSDPNDRHIREWTGTQQFPQKFVARLLKEMEREGLITIELVNDRGTIRRILTPTGKRIDN